uniref:Tc1-like transposase DDE domain-containing protein n=1 Tax=Sinocyclocheilus grahami TaxID=75366 RepID=A0A672JUL7_SINGR
MIPLIFPKWLNTNVIVWGAFLPAGVGELLHCEQSDNALEYRRILQNGVMYQQDNAPAQTTKTIKKWLKNKSIRLMFWPGQSLSEPYSEYLVSH